VNPTLSDWFQDLCVQPSLTLPGPIRATGVFDAHIAGWRFAQIDIVAAPAEAFTVEVALSEAQHLSMEREGYLQEAIFGVIDVFLTAETAPLRKVRLKVVDAVVHPIDSSRLAFRLAGRDAGRKVLATVNRSTSAPIAS
jgi:hypothetical protein